MTKTQQISATEQFNENTIFHITERFLSQHYDFRYNEIKNDIEYKPAQSGKEWETMNENNLYLHLQKSNIKCSINNLLAILKSDFVPRFNPIVTYFKTLPAWTDKEPDFIDDLATHVHFEKQGQLNLQFKKWLVRAVRCAVEKDYYNKQAFILVHRQQNSGKSFFCRWLCPPELSDYIAEDLTTDKDTRILLTKNFLINMDELSSLHRKEINSLKALFAKDKINERLPFDRKNSILSRCCSFLGSTNMTEFLSDDTGSVRWLCFDIKKIDWKYSKSIDVNDIWRQAYALYLSHDFKSEMTSVDIKENELRNGKFRLMTIEEEIISQYFDLPNGNNEGDFMTPTDVANIIQTYTTFSRLSVMLIGRALKSLGYEKVKHPQKQVYGYQVIFNEPSYGTA